MNINKLRQKLCLMFSIDNVNKMLLYSIINDEFLNFLEEINFENIPNLCDIVYKKELEIIKKIEQTRNYDYIIELENYFSIIELITENSKFSNDLINELKERYGSNYLVSLEEIDGINESEDTLIKKYFFIKEYQEKQNFLGRTVLEKLLNEISCPYPENYTFYFEKLRNKQILNIEILSLLYSIFPKEQLTLLIGGKAYGLACLYSLGFKIPLTYVIPTNINIDASVLNILNKNIRYSVRSSCAVEDGDKYSFAGMFESYLDVSYSDLLYNINKVKDSVNSERVRNYIEKNKLKNGEMAVVINEYKEVTCSGVWFGIDVNKGIYEYVNDVGEKLVSGELTSTCVEFKENDNTLLRGINIGKTFINIQKSLGNLCDLEWAIIDNELVLLQLRSITKQVKINLNNKTSNGNLITGLGVSPGVYEGKLVYLKDFKNVNNFVEGSILLAEKTDVRWMNILEKVGGLVTEKGSLLCHAAIIARELNVPCITKISSLDFEKLKSATEVKINGEEGTIEIWK